MRTFKTTVYTFNELSDEAKEKAIVAQQNINIDDEWWDFTFSYLQEQGIRVRGFDEYSARIELTEYPLTVAVRLREAWTENTEIHQTALNFQNDAKNLEDIDEGTEEEFIRSLAEDVRIILRKEYEALSSAEMISDTLIANGYEFTAEGVMA